MAVEKPSKEAFERFHNDIDAAAAGILERFEWIGLPSDDEPHDYPSGNQWEDLHVRLGDAINNILKDWL